MENYTFSVLSCWFATPFILPHHPATLFCGLSPQRLGQLLRSHQFCIQEIFYVESEKMTWYNVMGGPGSTTTNFSNWNTHCGFNYSKERGMVILKEKLYCQFPKNPCNLTNVKVYHLYYYSSERGLMYTFIIIIYFNWCNI